MIDEKRLKTTPVQHIRNLVESIKDGKLTVTYYDPIDPTYSLSYEVCCTAADADTFISKYEDIVYALEAIAASPDKVVNGVTLKDVLTPEQMDIWNTYLNFDEEFDAGEYNLVEIYDMRECGAPLNDEEQELLERHYEWFETQCFKHLPKKVYSPVTFVNHVRRYEYFLFSKAPKTVLDEEGRRLAEEMILYYAVI